MCGCVFDVVRSLFLLTAPQPEVAQGGFVNFQILPVAGDDGSEKFVCPICKQELRNNHELTKHIRSHNTATVAMANTCTICGKVLSSQSSLDRHMLVHSGEWRWYYTRGYLERNSSRPLLLLVYSLNHCYHATLTLMLCIFKFRTVCRFSAD